MKLAQLTPAMVQDFRNQLHSEARSRAMVKRAVSSLGAILVNAMATGKVARNVVREQSNRRQRRIEKRHDARLQIGVDLPTKNEIRAMLNCAKE